MDPGTGKSPMGPAIGSSSMPSDTGGFSIVSCTRDSVGASDCVDFSAAAGADGFPGVFRRLVCDTVDGGAPLGSSKSESSNAPGMIFTVS